MQVLFTKNPDSWFSKSIQAVTQEPVSHVAFQFGPWVLHSNWRGVHAETLRTFYKKNQVVYKVPVWGISEDTLLRKFSEREFKPYDVPGILGFTLHLGLRRIFRPIVTKVNLLEYSSLDFCVELVQHLLDKPVDSLITPYQFYLQLTKGEQL